jgi:hypothetical protein
VYDLDESWRVQAIPALGLVAAEGNPEGGALWTESETLDVACGVEARLAVRFGAGPVEVGRVDLATSRRFVARYGRAFLAGLSAVELPRCETTRRGTPVHSVWWTGARSAAVKARAYCESFKVRGREPFERVRLEVQLRMRGCRRVEVDAVCDPEWRAAVFRRRLEPVLRQTSGLRCVTLPVLARALADEVRYGLRDVREAERLAGALVLLHSGAGCGYPRRTYYRRRAELRAAGYVVAEGFLEPVEVDLGSEVERAVAEFGAARAPDV